jgi:hypothetical protein
MKGPGFSRLPFAWRFGASTRDRAALGAAAFVHLLAFALARTTGRPPASRDLGAEPVANATELVDVDLEREITPPPRVDRGDPVQPRAGVSGASSRGGGRLAARASEKGAPSMEGVPAITAPSDDGWSFSAIAKTAPDLVALNRGGYRVGMAAEDHPDVASERPGEQKGNPFMALEDHDVALGLGRGAPVVLAVEEAARLADTMGTALFDVTLDGAGGVRVDLAKSSGGDPVGWDGLRAPIARLVAQKPLHLGGHGLRVRVEVDAVEKLADGRDVKSLGNHAAATLGQGGGAESVAMKEMPNVHVEHLGKICSARLQADPTGVSVAGGCSLENIDVPPRRIVAGREIGETRL